MSPVLCQEGWFLAKVRETGWFGGFAIFSRTRAGRRGRAIIEEKPPHSPRPGCHPYGITNFGQEPLICQTTRVAVSEGAGYSSSGSDRKRPRRSRVPYTTRKTSMPGDSG